MADKHVMETVVKLAGSVDPSLGKSAGKAAKALDKMNMKAIGMKVAFAAGALVAVKALADVSVGLYKLGASFDKAYDTIRVGTGATGKDLEALKGTFKDVYSSVPTSMEDAGKAVADYNTRLGLTGDKLSGLSKQAIAVSNMLGEDLNTTIQSSSQAFQVWNVNANDMSKSMDYAFKVSQATGIGFNELMQSMKTVGPQMQSLGFTFEQSAAMMGQMEKAGVNTNEALKAMKKSVGEFAKNGLSASEGFKTYAEAIKNAKTETEAVSLASEVFGQRAGSTMASAIRSGAMSIEAFTQAMQDSDESIMKAMWDTASAEEKFKLLGQQFQTMIEPLASGLFDAINDIMPIFMKALKDLQPSIESVVAAMLPVIKTFIPLIAQTMNDILPPLIEIIMTILPALSSILTSLGPVLKLLSFTIGTGINVALKGIIPIFKDLMSILTNLIDFVTNIFTGRWKEAWQNIVNVVVSLFRGLKDILLAPFKSVLNAVDNIKAKVSGGKTPDAKIPALAAGGFTNGLSFAGEAGREAVISFDPAYRSDNISTWLKAGEMLGVASGSGNNSYNLGGFTFTPNIYITESMSGDDIVSKLKNAEGEFCDMIDEWMERKSLGRYNTMSIQY